MSEFSSHEIEFYKSFFDYLKHLTTLSTGSIILLTAFLEKLFVQPKWKFLVVVALVGFMVSVVASVIAHTFLVLSFEPPKTEDMPWSNNFTMWILFAIWSGFLVGVAALAVFAIRNLY